MLATCYEDVSDPSGVSLACYEEVGGLAPRKFTGRCLLSWNLAFIQTKRASDHSCVGCGIWRAGNIDAVGVITVVWVVMPKARRRPFSALRPAMFDSSSGTEHASLHTNRWHQRFNDWRRQQCDCPKIVLLCEKKVHQQTTNDNFYSEIYLRTNI